MVAKAPATDGDGGLANQATGNLKQEAAIGGFSHHI
jgi:hypothetical protein